MHKILKIFLVSIFIFSLFLFTEKVSAEGVVTCFKTEEGVSQDKKIIINVRPTSGTLDLKDYIVGILNNDVDSQYVNNPLSHSYMGQTLKIDSDGILKTEYYYRLLIQKANYLVFLFKKDSKNEKQLVGQLKDCSFVVPEIDKTVIPPVDSETEEDSNQQNEPNQQNEQTDKKSLASPSRGLIPACPESGCGLPELIQLINKVINFLLFVVATPLAALIFAYAGFKLLTSGGNSEAMTTTKKIMQNLLLGYVIALAAWLIVNTIIMALGFDASWFITKVKF